MRILRLLRHTVGIGLCLTLFAAAQADTARRPARHDTDVQPVIFVGSQKIHAPAFIDRGRVLVPVRGVFEAIGAFVSYSAPHFVVVRKDGIVLAAFILGRNHAIAGQRAVDLEAPPVRRDGRIYVPLRIVAEAAGATVAYTNRPPTVHIEQQGGSVAAVAAPADPPVGDEPSIAHAESSTAHWRVGVAVVTALCCLGCLVLTARRFGPVLFRPAPARRSTFPTASDSARNVPPADSVALTSVEANGEARFHKQIVRETRTIEVPITREELVIEYAGEGGTVIIQGRALEAGETVRIPLWEERVHVDVTKHVVLTEDIVIDKRRINVTHAVRGPARDELPEPDLAEGSPS